MKTVSSKSGLIITMLLVVVLLAFGVVNKQSQTTSDDCSVVEKQSSNAVQSKLNFKGMTRHILDFYK